MEYTSKRRWYTYFVPEVELLPKELQVATATSRAFYESYYDFADLRLLQQQEFLKRVDSKWSLEKLLHSKDPFIQATDPKDQIPTSEWGKLQLIAGFSVLRYEWKLCGVIIDVCYFSSRDVYLFVKAEEPVSYLEEYKAFPIKVLEFLQLHKPFYFSLFENHFTEQMDYPHIFDKSRNRAGHFAVNPLAKQRDQVTDWMYWTEEQSLQFTGLTLRQLEEVAGQWVLQYSDDQGKLQYKFFKNHRLAWKDPSRQHSSCFSIKQIPCPPLPDEKLDKRLGCMDEINLK